MHQDDCFRCRGWRRCITCLGRGRRVRITGILFRRRTVVECRDCHGTGECLLCRKPPPPPETIRSASP